MMKQTVKSLKAKARYALWKCAQIFHARDAAKLYDINRTYYIDPTCLKRALTRRSQEGLGDNAPPVHSPLDEHGAILGGDWDLKTVDFEDLEVWRAFQHRFVEGGAWSETDFYRGVAGRISGGKRLWGCASVAEFDARLADIETLYADIRDKGFREQPEIPSGQRRSFSDSDEIHVHIGRDGEYIFADGRHRLCIARLLDLPEVPVKVARRHSDWVELRRWILYYASMHRGRLYAPLTHPDLADIPSAHQHDRWELIAPHLDPAGGTAMDIGTHWGYFCHRLDAMGYRCTAVERDPLNLKMLKRLMRAEGRHFEIVANSILKFQPPHRYDVIFALNIFHHFIKSPEGHESLERLLGRLEVGRMIFQPHDPEELQMRGAYRNYGPEEFCRFVADRVGLDAIEHIGAAADGRNIYLLSRKDA